MKNNFRLTQDEIRQLCEAGSMAPSGGNAQPWLVKVKGDTLNLTINPGRSVSFLDVEGYASFFALGCFAENLFLAAEHLGLSYKAQFINSKNLKNFHFQIIFIERKNGKNELFRYIKDRSTNRKISDGSFIESALIDQIINIPSAASLKMQLSAVFLANDKTRIAKALGKADGVRMMNNELFKEMMNEIRWSEEEVSETRDGLDLKTLEVPANLGKMLKLVKKFPMLRNTVPLSSFENMAKPLLLGCSHLCCLSTPEKLTPEVMFEAGRILEKIWLTATKLNISFQPWTVLPFFIMRMNFLKGKGFSSSEIETLKKAVEDFKEAFGLATQDMPLFIFRLSRSKPPSARSLRIPWTQFTEIKN